MTWTDAKNERRCDLIDVEIDGVLAPGERVELDRLQGEMRRWLREEHPLPPVPEIREYAR